MNLQPSQGNLLTPEQVALLPKYQQKWTRFAWSTEPIDRATAEEVVQAIYRLAKLDLPQVKFCANPQELREHVQAYLEADPEGLRQSGYYRDYGCWHKIRRYLDLPFCLDVHGLYNQLGDGVLKQLEQLLRASLQEQLQKQWGTIRTQLGLNFVGGLEASLWGVMNYPEWIISYSSLIDFCVSELGCLYDREHWQLMQTLSTKVGWIVPLIGICWVCDRPTKVTFDNSGQLHGQMEPALEYRGDFQVFAYHGLRLNERYHAKPPSQWRATWLLMDRSPDYQRMIIQEIGYDRICQELKAKVIDVRQNHTLLWIPLSVARRQYLLKTTCNTTGTSQYVEVPSQVKSVREALDWVNSNQLI